MSVPSAPVLVRIQKFLPSVWIVALVAAVLVQVLAASRRAERVQALTARPTWSVDAPDRSKASATGWARGQRRQLVPGHHNPSFWWIAEAQQAAATGAWRLRQIDTDAMPDGRDMQRTSPYRWWLMGVGAGAAAWTGQSWGAGIETGALVADPLLWALATVLGAWVCARIWGGAAAVAWSLGATTLFPLAAGFQPGAPDPHAMAWVLAMGSVLGVMAGAGNRRGLIMAALCGGVGFWNEAAAQWGVWLAMGAGALAWELLDAQGAPARAWRCWAAVGGLVTVVGTAWEFGWAGGWTSLPAVSFWHAVVWFGLGELLTAVSAWRRAGRGAPTRAVSVSLVLGGLGVLAWPVASLLVETGGWWAGDFYARELANHPRAGVAANLGAWLSGTKDGAAKVALLLPVMVAGVLLWRRRRADRARVLAVTFALVVMLGLAGGQLRWWNAVDGLVLIGLALAFAGASLAGRRTRVELALVAVALSPGWVVGFPRAVGVSEGSKPTPLETQALIARDFAAWISLRSGDGPVVLFSTPIFADAVAFYGGFRAVVSSDATNRTGNLAAVRLASASTAQEVEILLESQQVTHIALPLWDPGLDQLVRIGANLAPGQELPPSAFAVSLRWWDMPLTVQPLDYLIPREAEFASFELRAFTVGPEQSPELGLSRLADFFVERGQVREALAMRENLQMFARHPAVLGAMANVAVAARDVAALNEALEKLVPMLSRRAVRSLPADRRLSLAALLTRVRRAELAREQLVACMENLDAPTLRAWTPGAVVSLWALSRAEGIAFPDPALEALAWQLIPPQVRNTLPK